LPAEAQLDRIEVVLVSPRNPLNIGAAARAMANFGFEHLAVVAPYEPHWREANSAVGAEALLKKARRTESIAEALAPCTLAVGTGTLDHRKPEQPVVSLPELPPLLRAELDRGGRIGLVFGPEKHGLTREDLALCHLLAVIPTSDRQPSMNLGQAVAVCLYELATRLVALPPIKKGGSKKPPEPAAAPPLARAGHPVPSSDLDQLAALIAETMQAARYSPAAMQKANRHDLDLLLRRLSLGPRDARRLLGLFRRILHRIKPYRSGN
jgi:tRNA/rRNA methyltransferase